MASYKLNLKGLINSFEVNYMLLNRLLGSMNEVGETLDFFINDHLVYKLSVLEKSKYTHVVEFKQVRHFELNDPLAKTFHNPCMKIRLYHDARAAEVLESQYVKQIKPKYEYPNKDMHQPDEKQQTHHFLTQWLQLCLSQGKTAIKSSIKDQEK